MRVRLFLIPIMCILSIGGLWAQGKAFLFSLAVPGYSQIKSGKSYGYAMLAAEATLIGASMYLSKESDLLLEEAYTYALKYAHLNPADYDSYFLKNLGTYESSGYDTNGYNAAIRREAMSLYPDDPIAQQSFIDAHAYGEDQYWYWDSTDNRRQYNKLRNDSQDLQSYGKLVFGVIILNHLVSGIDILRHHSQERRTELSVDIVQEHPMLKMSLKF